MQEEYLKIIEPLIEPVTRLEVVKKRLSIIEEELDNFIDTGVTTNLQDFIHDFEVLKLVYISALADVKELEERKSCIE